MVKNLVEPELFMLQLLQWSILGLNMLKRPRLGSVHRLGEAKNVPTPVISTCYRSLAV